MKYRYLLLIAISFCLLSCFDNNEKTISVGDTSNGEHTKKTDEKEKIVLNFYLENSGSMDGFVNDEDTNLRTQMYKFLVDIKDYIDTAKYYYINSEIIPIEKELDTYIETIDISTFKNEGGNRKSSNIRNILDTVLNKTSNKDLSIIVSDFISDEGFLKGNLQETIKDKFREKLKKDTSFSVVVFRVMANFNGNYYYYKNNKKYLENKMRPYFVFVMGDYNKLIKLFNGKDISKVIPNTTHYYVFAKEKDIKYTLYKNGETDSITREFRKNETIDIIYYTSNLLIEKSYLQNKSNYEKTSGGIEINKIEPSEENITITTKITNVKQLKSFDIKIKRPTLDWVGSVSTEDTLWSEKDSEKTYGIGYILKGLDEVYKDKILTNIKINVK
ncbi:MAG: hypothetical protein IJ180_07930 [Bacteroidales bacterium]|nr:hypothetical protein [Bacteroidales bacterium]